jgi:signal transduction histidine kinase
MLGRMKAGSIRWQIAAAATVPVILASFLAVLTQPLTLLHSDVLPDARITALRIETVIEQFRAAKTPQQEAVLVALVSDSGLPVAKALVGDLDPSPEIAVTRNDIRRMVKNYLPDTLRTAFKSGSTENAHDTLVVGTGDGRALAFQLAAVDPEPWFTDKQKEITIKVILVLLPVLLLSLWVSSLITAPLLKFADAAQVLKPDDGPDRPFEEDGAAEIRTLARSLNDMRSRVRSMIEDRTRMLRAISHDLRTPLTRLRLRAERSTQPELKASLLADIVALGGMIDDTLTYLSKDTSRGEQINADLPSLLQTVSSDFSDMGYDVRYTGPERFTYRCKPRWLARAVTNLVENSTKYAQHIDITMECHENGSVRITVVDDGPGLPVNLRTRVLEPFFKVESARTSGERTGFGLGLSIVDDIVRAHNGTIELRNALPHGLIAEINLPSEQAHPAVSKSRPLSRIA